jgi:hypothetical protein
MFTCRFSNGILPMNKEFHPSKLCFLKWGIQYFVVWDCSLAGFLMGFFWLAEYFHLPVFHCWHEKFNVLEFQRSTTSWKVKAFNTAIVCPLGDKPSLFLYNRFLLPFFRRGLHYMKLFGEHVWNLPWSIVCVSIIYFRNTRAVSRLHRVMSAIVTELPHSLSSIWSVEYL